MVVERVTVQHHRIKDWGDETLDIIEECEGGHTTRPHTEQLVEIRRAAERKARRAQSNRELLEINSTLFEHNGEPITALLVLEKEALAMSPRETSAQSSRLGDREDGWVRIGAMHDPEFVEMREQVLGGHRRRRHDGYDVIRLIGRQGLQTLLAGLSCPQIRRGRPISAVDAG